MDISIKNKADSKKLLKVAPFRKEVRKTTPHMHDNYFEIIYLSAGSGTHFIDNKAYQIIPPVVFFVRKEQVHHWDITEVPQGYVLILKNAFIHQSIDLDLKALLEKISFSDCLQLTETQTIEQVFDLLIKEDDFSIIEGLLKVLLNKMLQVANNSEQEHDIKEDLFHSFKHLLHRSNPVTNSISHYAELLNTTPQNLNNVCRKSVQQSATQVLSEYIISKAKRFLIYTDHTISQISYALGFNDPSHFVKYFKRHTNKTPKSYRKLHIIAVLLQLFHQNVSIGGMF